MKVKPMFSSPNGIGLQDYLSALGVKDTRSYLKFNTYESDLNYDNIEIAVETLKRYRDREVTILVDS